MPLEASHPNADDQGDAPTPQCSLCDDDMDDVDLEASKDIPEHVCVRCLHCSECRQLMDPPDDRDPKRCEQCANDERLYQAMCKRQDDAEAHADYLHDRMKDEGF